VTHQCSSDGGVHADDPVTYGPRIVQFGAVNRFSQYWYSGVFPGGHVARPVSTTGTPTVIVKFCTGDVIVTDVHGFGLSASATSVPSPSPSPELKDSGAQLLSARAPSAASAAPRGAENDVHVRGE
jgi:hypothetical protein